MAAAARPAIARRALAALLRTRVPRALVLSLNELPPTQPVEVVSVIGGQQLPPQPPQLEHHDQQVMAA